MIDKRLVVAPILRQFCSHSSQFWLMRDSLPRVRQLVT